MGMSDAQLIERYKLGNEEAFEELLQKYKSPLFNYILRMVKNKTVAEDIFQDAWIQIIKSLPRYKEQNKFSALLFKIANFKAIDYFRKNKHFKDKRDTLSNVETHCNASLLPRYDISYNTVIERDIEKEELLSILNKAVMELPLKQKEIFLLRQHSGLTFKEIAQMLNYPLNTVLARMHNAVLNLRKTLKGV